MPKAQLTSFEHVLLGMISAQPASGYDLKRRFATSPMGVYQPSSGALYPALERLERRGLLGSDTLRPAAGGRPRRVYRLTPDGQQAHLGWVREPVRPETVAQDLGMHLLRFVMMADVLPPDEVLLFLADLRAALTRFVATLEQASAGPDLAANIAARLAVEHGLAVYRASLAWTEQAAVALAGRTAAG
jgi:PadR family transcriptional regulator, regulatory protein AphA